MILKKGERVTTEKGDVVCYVKEDYNSEDHFLGGKLSMSLFCDWVFPKPAPFSVLDKRYFKPNPSKPHSMMICIEGEWR